MRIYGSLHNRLMEASKQPVPVIGMEATITSYSDRHAGTVINVGPKMVVIQEDKSIRTDTNGMSDCQSYRYERDSEGRLVTFRQDRSGHWREVKFNSESRRYRFVDGGCGLVLGNRDSYYDYSF